MSVTMDKTMIKPLTDRIVVRALAREQKTSSGIVLPDTAKEKPQEGEVIAVGPGRFEAGQRIAPEVKVGDRVIFAKYAGTEFKVNNEELLIMRESDLLAVIS